MTVTELLVAVAIAVGVAGIIVPVLPGTVLVLGAILVWALEIGTTTAWLVFAFAATFLVLGTVVKYLVPGRQLKSSGVPTRTLVAGGVLAFVGFFVVPVVGLFLGFVLGVYLAELARLDDRAAAWPSARRALSAVGWSILIELASALMATAVWIAGLAVG